MYLDMAGGLHNFERTEYLKELLGQLRDVKVLRLGKGIIMVNKLALLAFLLLVGCSGSQVQLPNGSITVATPVGTFTGTNNNGAVTVITPDQPIRIGGTTVTVGK